MSAVLPWFRFHTDKWLRSELVKGMSLEQEGACLRLMIEQWNEGSIPAGQIWAARALGVTLEHYQNHVADAVEAFFPVSESGRRANMNLAIERENTILFTERQSLNGKLGGRPRQGNQVDKTHRLTHGLATANPPPNPRQTHCLTQTKPTRNPDESPRALSLSSSVVSSEVLSTALSTEVSTHAYAHVKEPDPLGKPDSAKQRQAVKAHEAESRRLLACLNLARKASGVSGRAITPRYGSLAGIAWRLDAGHSAADVEHVIAVYEYESRTNPESRKYFDTVSPFRPDNFERALAKEPQATTLPLPTASDSYPYKRDLAETMRLRLAEGSGK